MNRRKKIETLALRSEIGKLYLSKNTQAEIGEIVGLTQQAISLHLKVLQKEWVKSANKDFDLSRAIELARIDNIESKAHAAWQASREDKTTETTETASEVETKTQIKTQSQYGDPRFLDIVLKCISKRCDILDLYASSKLAPSGKESITKGRGLVGLLEEAERIVEEESVQQRIYKQVMDATN